MRESTLDDRVPWAMRLRVLVSPDKAAVGSCRELQPRLPVEVGRKPAQDSRRVDTVEIRDQGISRRHLRLTEGADERVEVEDLKTKNGTRVDRAHLVGAVAVYGDVVIRLGDTVLHLGRSLPDATADRLLEDPLVRWLAEWTPPGCLMIESPPGSGATELARRLHKLRGAAGPLVDVGRNQWLAEQPDSILEPAAGGTVLLREARGLRGSDAAVWVARAEALQVKLIVQAPSLERSVRRLVEPEARLRLPPVAKRRACVWGLTRAWLRRSFGRAPQFKAGAAATWLWAPFPQGWETLRERVDRLVDALDPDADEIRTRDIRPIL